MLFHSDQFFGLLLLLDDVIVVKKNTVNSTSQAPINKSSAGRSQRTISFAAVVF